MPKLLFIFIFFSFITTVSAQKHPHRKAKKAVVVMQGICGTVLEKQGNHMPSPDAPRPNANGTPVEREVLIFPLLNLNQIDAGDNGFINSVRDAKPIKIVKSGKDGSFCASLPTGRYTVIVREPKGLYANLFDTQSNIFPVTVSKDKTAKIIIDISHQAVF